MSCMMRPFLPITLPKITVAKPLLNELLHQDYSHDLIDDRDYLMNLYQSLFTRVETLNVWTLCTVLLTTK